MECWPRHALWASVSWIPWRIAPLLFRCGCNRWVVVGLAGPAGLAATAMRMTRYTVRIFLTSIIHWMSAVLAHHFQQPKATATDNPIASKPALSSSHGGLASTSWNGVTRTGEIIYKLGILFLKVRSTESLVRILGMVRGFETSCN